MRHIRTRRRFKIILALLCIVCFMAFVESRIEDLIPQLKSLAEARVEEALGGGIKFSIGSIDGGLIHPIVINDIRIGRANAMRLTQSLVIDNIRTNYYIKDIIRAAGGGGLPPLLNRDSWTYVNFSLNNADIKGFAGLYGSLADSKIDGYLVLRGGEKIKFAGSIKGDLFDVEITREYAGTGSIRAFGTIAPDKPLIVNLKVDNLKLYGLNISCDAVFRNRLVKSSNPAVPDSMEGEFEASKLMLNFKPFLDVKASYKATKELVELSSLTLGETFKTYGKVSLRYPESVDLTILVNNLSLSWLMLALGKKEAISILTGTMNGKFELKGPVKKIRIDSCFDIKTGTMGPLDFDYLTANLKGELPFLKIEDTRVTRKSGYFDLAGELDLRLAGKDCMFDHIRLITDDSAIAWDEWSLTSGKDSKEIEMKKNLAGGFGFVYKTFVKEGAIDESLKDTDEIRLDYNFYQNDSLKLMVGQDKDFFGFEHKDKF
ncbi:MAG: hypothetical protein JXB40_02740 [Candidatus Omnitrophica bacterium]|nr:hypothetical protein [Candidatus Omnitrophota bacterium]